jgi:aminoglycoside phosphotransferase (APT) family kinase protein
MSASAGQGLNEASVSAWLGEAVGAEAPVSFSLVGGGRSNLTYRAIDAFGQTWAVRRPPLGELLPTAHDMGREYRILRALARDGTVPVPKPVAFCDDLAVTGSPFYAMDFVDGHVLHDEHTTDVSADELRQLGESMIDVLADLHAIGPADVGLNELGRHDDYIQRQLRRWHRQFHTSTARKLPLVDELHDELAAATPAQRGVSIVHGDYRIENCILDRSWAVIAVLDWETCTLGDPLADVGHFAINWSDSPEGRTDVLMQRYEARSGRDLSSLPFFIAFGHWRTACILEGVYSRYLAGGGGGDAGDFDHYRDRVPEHLQHAQSWLRQSC